MSTQVRGRTIPAGGVARVEARVARAVAFGFLPGGLVFGALIVPTVVRQFLDTPPVWTVIAFTAVLLPTIAAGALAFFAPLSVIRWLARIAFVASLLSTATLPLVVRPMGGAPSWVRDISPIGVIIGVLAVQAAVELGAVLLEAALLGLDRVATSGGVVTVAALQDALYSLLFVTVFVAFGIALLAASRAADDAETAAQDAAAAAAVDAAREREQARVNALVHDRVLATLLSAANRTPGTATLVRSDAARALADMRGLLVDEPARAPVGAQELIWALQAVTTDLAPDASFGYRLGDGAPVVTPHVAETVAAATEEALRNSIRHADAPNRTVHVEVDADELRVDVLDDGVGFEPEQVPQTRLGITESILGRMRGLPGGDAFVVSAPGVGTRVQLRLRMAAS